LRHALGIHPGLKSIEEHQKFLPQLERYVDLCAGLVNISVEGKKISLAHPTVKEYLERNREGISLPGQDRISRDCLTYLSFENFATSVCTSDYQLAVRRTLHPFFDYVSQYWGRHLASDPERILQSEVGILFDNDNALCSAVQPTATLPFHLSDVKALDTSGHWEDFDLFGEVSEDGNIPAAAVASEWGFFHGEENLGSSPSPRQRKMKDERCWIVTKTTPLHAAIAFDLSFTLSRLLESQAVVNATDSHGRTALYFAAQTGHEAALNLLLDHQADMEIGDRDSWKPLYIASYNGHQGIVEILQSRGAQITLPNLHDTESQQMRRLFEAVWRLIGVDYKYPGAERLSFTQFEAYDIRHVTEMYPRCPVFLLQRLGVTNTSRRRVLKYLKIHAERLSVISDKEQIPLRSELLKPTIGPPQNRERSHFSETVASFVTDPRPPDFKEFFLNKKTLEPSLVEGMLPPFPQEQTTTQQGLCTYCYQPLNETDPKGWK